MSASSGPPPSASWHVLLAPLPPEAIVQCTPVAPAEVLAGPGGDAIAGWTSLTVELSAGAAGLRHLMVTLDANGHPISAGDTVLYAHGRDITQESVGGRIDPALVSTPSSPSAGDAARLLALVAEILRRVPAT